MKRLLVATDFSTRSDRALRRATLLARQLSAEIVLVHVVDDDQPPRLVKAQERESQGLLTDLAATLREIDQVHCETRVVLGEPFHAIAEMAERADADVVVMGAHRRQALRDVFIGTTIERTIRRSRRPVIMANAIPAGNYDRVLVAVDFSGCAAIAVKEARKLGLLDRTEVLVLHAFEAPVQNMTIRASITMDQLKDHIAEEEERAAGELLKFLREVDLRPSRHFVQLIELSAPETIRDCVRKHKVDLVVMGTHGRTGPAKFFLGSVAEEVLRNSDVDVLVVPAAASLPSEPQ
ncbi:universal stress protein [Pseudorhodoplanes sinuspersici]|uniref:Universal stress protein UspA n=1 Tax=Pseudorhodoplanes sinuspersici TaxID=1235591 RepID=A0A1W6ZPH9_9HYPH|nr:universal stress protein [Pseudorhodoplanes sinuspersici]ARP99222.1 universal stress protein UspA [Pseudorhodoplanes sinuspersici]RKE69112.1 nucleotide-binding universal stress UspA family protein [Pseudorhodoplanes sinuspersici]